MTRTAGGWRGGTRTRSVVYSEVTVLRDESAYSGRGGMSVNRCHPADRAEFRRRLLSCDVFQDFLNDIWSCHIADHAQPTAAVRADRQINREHSAQPLHPAHRCSRCSRIVLMISTRRRHRSVSSRAPSAGSSPDPAGTLADGADPAHGGPADNTHSVDVDEGGGPSHLTAQRLS